MSSVEETVERLKELIPGYKGYAEKEDRRAADRELRDAVAAAFESQSDRLARAQERVLSHGDFTGLEALDKARSRLQHLAERIRHASYGYAGFFDRTKQYDLPDLDRLYAFDLKLANGVDKVGELIAQIGVAQNVSEQAHKLLEQVDQLHTTFDRRQHLIDTFPRETGDVQAEEQPAAEETPAEEE